MNLKWTVILLLIIVGLAVYIVADYQGDKALEAENELLKNEEARLEGELALKDKAAEEAIAKYEERIALLNGEIETF